MNRTIGGKDYEVTKRGGGRTFVSTKSPNKHVFSESGNGLKIRVTRKTGEFPAATSGQPKRRYDSEMVQEGFGSRGRKKVYQQTTVKGVGQKTTHQGKTSKRLEK